MIRIMIFPSRPDCILFYVPDGEQLTIPPVPAPFNKKSVADIFAGANVACRITESVPGRWTESMMMMRKADKAERRQLQTQREASQATIERGGTLLARTRAEAITRKHLVDEQIREIKTWIGQAKSRAFSGQYERPELFRAKQRDLAELQTESLAIQQQLGALKKQEKAENIAASNEEMQMFRRAARRVLTEAQFDAILDAMADDLDDEDAETDSKNFAMKGGTK